MPVPVRRTRSLGAQEAARPPDLPDFEDPPVTEVFLSIQFGALSDFRNGHIGLFWSKFRKQYPKLFEQAPLQPVFETFGVPPQATPFLRVQIETMLAPPMSRYWFMKDTEDELVQVQQDRIVHNWRKQRGDQIY